jgi:hypothetical protein
VALVCLNGFLDSVLFEPVLARQTPSERCRACIPMEVLPKQGDYGFNHVRTGPENVTAEHI